MSNRSSVSRPDSTPSRAARLPAEVWDLGGSAEAINEATVRAGDRLVAGEPLSATTLLLSC